jgi:PIN domain nuclease of toxin-antitoxin system
MLPQRNVDKMSAKGGLKGFEQLEKKVAELDRMLQRPDLRVHDIRHWVAVQPSKSDWAHRSPAKRLI